MQNIGQRLEEARKRLGINIREAAEATKLRSDFLISFENNDFELDLPEVYRRGFLKLYATYLKLDVGKVMTDYQALCLGLSKSTRPEKDLLGRLELAPRTEAMAEKADSTAASASQEAAAKQQQALANKSLYAKVGLVVIATFAIVLAIGFGVKTLISSGTPNDLQDSLVGATAMTAGLGDISIAEPELMEEEVILIADKDVHVVVRQESDHTRLFSGKISQGQQVPLTKKGKIKIHFSDGANLQLEKDGQRYGMNAEGIAVRVFD